MAAPTTHFDPEIADNTERRRELAAPSPRRVTLLRGVGAGLGLLVVAIAVVAMIGWVTGVHQLARWVDGAVTMKVITTVLLSLLGASLVLLNTSIAGMRRYLVVGLALMVSTLTLCLVLQSIFDFRIEALDTFFGLQPPEPQAPNRGRAAPLTAVAGCLLGAGALAAVLGKSVWSQALALGALLIGTTAMIGFGFGVTESYAGGVYAVMAVPTGVALFCAALSLLLVAPDRGLMVSLTSDTAGGSMARRVIPLIVTIAIAISLIATLDLWRSSVDPRFRPAMVTTMLLMVGVGGTWIFAWRMRGLDLSRGGAEDTVASTRQIVAERDAMLAERDELARHLARANEDLSSFAAVAAHDLRAPLVAIRGYAELLADHPSMVDDARGQEWIQRIMSGSDRGAQLIVDVLDCARLNTRVLQRRSVDLQVLVSDLVEAGEHAAHVDLQPLPTVLGEATLLRQLFNNLIENAFKYAPTDRQIRVGIDAVPTPAEGGQQMVQIRVSDTGDGIAAEDRERLLGMFVRGHHTEVAGTGLGLAICARVADRHGGRLWIEGDPSGGARVCVTLPLAQ